VRVHLLLDLIDRHTRLDDVMCRRLPLLPSLVGTKRAIRRPLQSRVMAECPVEPDAPSDGKNCNRGKSCNWRGDPGSNGECSHIAGD